MLMLKKRAGDVTVEILSEFYECDGGNKTDSYYEIRVRRVEWSKVLHSTLS